MEEEKEQEKKEIGDQQSEIVRSPLISVPLSPLCCLCWCASFRSVCFMSSLVNNTQYSQFSCRWHPYILSYLCYSVLFYLCCVSLAIAPHFLHHQRSCISSREPHTGSLQRFAIVNLVAHGWPGYSMYCLSYCAIWYTLFEQPPSRFANLLATVR